MHLSAVIAVRIGVCTAVFWCRSGGVVVFLCFGSYCFLRFSSGVFVARFLYRSGGG